MRFYTAHVAKVAGHAVEVDKPHGKVRVMTTRYCLRRSMGACLRGKNAGLLPDRLWLDAPIGRLELKFDCDNCRMQVYTDIP